MKKQSDSEEVIAKRPTIERNVSMASDLPDEIIVNILSRLPLKSLMRFRCVCKPWLALLSHPRFSEFHFQCSKEDLRRKSILLSNLYLYSLSCETILCSAEDGELIPDQLHIPLIKDINEAIETKTFRKIRKDLEEEGFFFRENRKCRIDILCSCNGLVHVRLAVGLFLIVNPYTGESKKIAEPQHSRKLVTVVYGMGYDGSTDDYKVVAIVDVCKVSVYSLRSNAWRSIGRFPYDKYVCVENGIHLREAIHWLGCDNSCSKQNIFKYSFAAFDLASEEFREMKVPNEISPSNIWEVGVLGECLCMVVNRVDHHHVWIMKEYGVDQSWTKQFTISTPEYSLKPLCFLHNDEPLFLADNSCLILFNPNEGRCKHLFLPRCLDGSEPKPCDAEVYAKSLVSPNEFGRKWKEQSRMGNNVEEGTLKGNLRDV